MTFVRGSTCFVSLLDQLRTNKVSKAMVFQSLPLIQELKVYDKHIFVADLGFY